MTQLDLLPDQAERRTCPVLRFPYADGRGVARVHECGRYAVNIWPCHDCDDHPGDRSSPAVRAFSGEGQAA